MRSDLASLRDAVAVVPEKCSILEHGTRQLVLGALEPLTRCLRYVKLPWTGFSSRISGLDGDLGQGGVNVSGRSKSSACVRDALKHPQVLVRGDSTSAVDTAADAKSEAVWRIKNTTKIVSLSV